MILDELVPEMFTRSKVLILDFAQIPENTPPAENIQLFFEDSLKKATNPRLPANRQKFNNQMLAKSGGRYLIGRYGEDRRAMLTGTDIAKSGRTIHLGIDFFCKDLEPILAPCDGEVIRSGFENGPASYGHYLILHPDNQHNLYFFFGHLGSGAVRPSTRVTRGQTIARIGDYKKGENGGWSRHLHFQVLKKLPPAGQLPIGYSSAKDFDENSTLFPDPTTHLLRFV